MKRSFAAWILLMTPSSSFATRSASKKRLTMYFSPFAHLAVLALIFSSSLPTMSHVCIGLLLGRTRYGLKSETGAPEIQKTIG
jgi:predicted membrane channel-forming protein YqfA (hemolysin III family)